ncbi:MAG: hypothetical protein ACI4LA_03430 [Emergencia sp.]
MKRPVTVLLAAVLSVTMLLCSAAAVFGAEGYEEVAGSGEMSSVEEVGVEGMFPIYGTDIVDGTYDITVESSSSMFHVEKAVLTVKDGKMEAVMTMGGKGYLKVFMGTGKEAAKAELSEYIDYEVDSDGKHTFTVPVEALDTAIPCAAFSKNKEKWYDRSILFEAEGLPEDAVKVERPDYDALEKAAMEKRIEAMKEQNEQGQTGNAVSVDLKDGEYTVEVDLGGGTGRATIASPGILVVKDGKAYARIEWSSPNYDYMLVDGEKYLPIQQEGNSVFEIPITVFDEPMDVIADTTAMSVPHEIEYTLLFHSDSLPQGGNSLLLIIAAAAAVVLIAAAVIIYRKKKH